MGHHRYPAKDDTPEQASRPDQAVSLTSKPKADQAAKLVTEALYPPWVAIALLGLIAAYNTANVAKFLQWWGLSAFFVAVVPSGFILFALRRGRISDRRMTRARERILPFTVAMLSIGIGTGVMWLLEAPREVLAVTTGAVVGMVVSIALAPQLKLSIHTASVAGSVAILTLAFGAWSLLLTPLVPLVGWARVRISHHTPAQVVAGAVIGAAVAAGVYSGVLAIA